MQRFFVDPDLLKTEEILLPAEIRHHLGTVLRRSAGEEVLLLDGAGEICRCRITSLDRKQGTARVTERRREDPPRFSLTLLQGLPKGEKMDLVLQKGTELGVTRFVPVLAGRSIPRLPDRRGEQRQERWQRIIREAARQCRRAWLPELTPPLPLEEALGRSAEELRLFFWEEESRPLAAVLPRKAPASAAVLVGPEGGFGAEEAECAERNGFLAAGLGPRILRSETAGLAVASILQHAYGDLGADPGTSREVPPPKEIP